MTVSPATTNRPPTEGGNCQVIERHSCMPGGPGTRSCSIAVNDDLIPTCNLIGQPCRGLLTAGRRPVTAFALWCAGMRNALGLPTNRINPERFARILNGWSAAFKHAGASLTGSGLNAKQNRHLIRGAATSAAGQKRNTPQRRTRFSRGPGARQQRRQPGHEMHRLQHDMRRSISKGMLVLVHHPLPAFHRQPFDRNG